MFKKQSEGFSMQAAIQDRRDRHNELARIDRIAQEMFLELSKLGVVIVNSPKVANALKAIVVAQGQKYKWQNGPDRVIFAKVQTQVPAA